MRYPVLVLPFLVLTGFSASRGGERDSVVLVEDGFPRASIVLPLGATAEVESAATFIQRYLFAMSSAMVPVTHRHDTSEVRIELVVERDRGGLLSQEAAESDGFRIRVRPASVTLIAATPKGLQNAASTFLESVLGCRYFARDAVHIPSRRTIVVHTLDQTQVPEFKFRVVYYGEAFCREYGRWHKLNNDSWDDRPSASGPISIQWGMWVHTVHRLVPPDSLFTSHPEFFAYRNGIRLRDQLCLANDTVLSIAIASLRREITANPAATFWSVSQMDNYNYCECPRCRAVDSLEGSSSGSVLRFVNAVAREFPDRVISTLAYQYSRKPPLHTRPAPNVNIMLCTIECDRSRPIEADTSEGGFLRDLQGWSTIAPDILVWDYVINFSHIVAPFPNLHVLQPNLRLFRRYGVGMVFEQGWSGRSGEMEELRCYILSKLLWAPDANVDTLTADFLTGYYGPAGRFIGEYLQRANAELVASGKALTLYEPPVVHREGFLAPRMIERYAALFDSAEASVRGDTVLGTRVSLARQPLRYAGLEVRRSLVHTPDWLFERTAEGQLVVKPEVVRTLEDFTRIARQWGPAMLHESGNPPEEYFRRMTEYFANGVVDHRAVNCPVIFRSPPDPRYSASGAGTVTDGVLGTEQYQSMWLGWQGADMVATIDLGSEQSVSSVAVHCLDDNMSWIMLPASVDVEASVDGNRFEKAGSLRNDQARERLPRQIRTLRVDLSTPARARYIRVTAATIGRLPAWRGPDGEAWVFVDEIMVQ